MPDSGPSSLTPAPRESRGPLAWMKSALATRFSRRLAALLVLLLILYELVIPQIALTSCGGFVSANLVQVHADQAGSLTELNAQAGSPITTGAPIGMVMANTDQGAALDDRREVERLEDICEAYRQQRDQIESFSQKLTARSDTFTKYLSQFDLALFKSAHAASDAYTTQAKSLGRNVTRQSKTSKHGWTAFSDRDAMIAEQAAAAANAGTNTYDAEAAAIRVNAATRGFLLDSGTDGATYYVQKHDELSLQLINLNLQLKIAQAQMNAAASRLRSLLAQDHRMITAPVTGLIWQQYASRGQSLTDHSPIVDIADASSTFVLAVTQAAQLARLRVGDAAVVHVDGFPGSLNGTIAGWVLTPAGTAGFAVAPHVAPPREVYVIVRLDPTDRTMLSSTLIGRRAAIVFPHPGWTWLADLVQQL